jgi:nitroreductase
MRIAGKESENMEAIDIRRSVRKYNGMPVEDEKIEKLLRAAMQAPSAGNQRESEFIVVSSRKSLEQLSAMSPYSGLIARAPLAIVLLGNTERMQFPENWEQDLGAAAENILIEAVDLDLGAVWLGVHPLEERIAAVRKQFSLPDNLRPFAVIAVGYPAEKEANHFEDRWERKRVHYE